MKNEMTKAKLPFWFRPYIILPLLAVLYVGIPSRWDFSPHVLTHTMPYFLVGATDWGVSNIYAFTKIAYWLGLTLGGVANALCAHPAGMSMASVTLWRVRLNAWHFGAALFLPVGAAWLMQGEDRLDMLLLAAYFAAGTLAIVALLKRLQDRGSPRLVRMTVALLAGVAWGFVRVSLGNP